MAEVTAFRNNALPCPIYGLPWVVVFPLLDADGDPVAPSAPDSERSLNGDTFADCTNEAVEIPTATGVCYLILTVAEMTADIVGLRVQSTGAKTTIMTLYPRKLVSLRAGTSQTGAAGTITLDASASAIDDYYNGCLIAATIDGNVECRIITDYVGSTKVASVAPNWNVTPDVDDTFIIYMPEGMQIKQADTVGLLGSAMAAPTVAGVQEVDVTHYGGTAGTFAAGVPGVNAIQISGLASAADDLEALTIGMVTGVADSGSTTTMVDAARTEADTDYWKGNIILFTSGAISGQCRLITGFDPATDAFTFFPATTQAVATQNYIIMPAAAVNVWGLLGVKSLDNLGETVPAVGRGTVTAGGTTTSIPTSAFTPAGAVADQFKDRVVLFDVDTTTPTLRGVAKLITASTNAATPTLTVETLPAAPASGDTFSVI